MIFFKKLWRESQIPSPWKLSLILLPLLVTSVAGPTRAQSLPSGWSHADIGAVGTAGSASYANGTFTVQGAGQLWGTSDKFHFVYQPLSGDGAIVARVANIQGGSSPQVGVMIRETLDPGAKDAFAFFQPNTAALYYRTTTGASTASTSTVLTGPSYPYWVRVVRSGNVFTGYFSLNGVYWTQIGASQTITMAQNVYAGLAVSSQTSGLATVAFDYVSVSSTTSPVPVITNVSATTGSIGSQVVINGVWFGGSQGNSAVYLNGAPVTINSWSDTSITITIPTGATSGYLVVAVAPTMNSSNAIVFAVTSQPLPSGWLDQDIGQVGTTGSGTYASGTFTVKGAGQLWGSSDKFHFVYQPLSGDGAIVARVANIQGGSSPQVGVMIRETLDPGAKDAFAFFQPNTAALYYRATTGASTASTTTGLTASSYPYWVRVVRSGNVFTGYISLDGWNWTQIGTSQTITMAQNVYAGLAVSSQTSSLATVAFDCASVSTLASPAPIITSVSATTGSIGSQVVITGVWFGSSQGNSVVYLNGAPVTINSWSDTSITITIPSGATSGYLAVAVAPSMNSSNAVVFTVTSQPLPSGWLDQDVGQVAVAGSATYANGTFTVKGSGQIGSTADKFHFVYQPLSGDGAIVARVANIQGSSSQAGVMIRETMNPGSTNVFVWFQPNQAILYNRPSTGASTNSPATSFTSAAYPYWVKLVRNGNTFSGYISLDGTYWTQVSTNVTISMALNAYAGLAVSGGSSLATVSFDNVSVSSTASPAPVITSVSATTGSIGSQVVINGVWFGGSQGSSAVYLNGAPMTINSWSDTSITITIPSGATSGYLAVAVAPSMSSSNAVRFAVTTQPLPNGWLDRDVGQVGTAGSATYTSGTFTVKGSNQISSTSDKFHFVYQSLLGDGAIVARVATLQGASFPQVGVIIRETLDVGSREAFAFFQPNQGIFYYRASTGGSVSSQATGFIAPSYPYWVRVTRNGNTFTGHISLNGTNWTQIGASQTITMAQTVYLGLAVASGATTLVTATFDNVAITFGTTPLVTGLSPNLGGTGQAVTITGANFGAAQGTSTVTFNGALASVTSWSDTQIVATVPAAAPRGVGPVVVAVNSVNSISNVSFTVIRPDITSLTPPAAAIGGTVTLSGVGFGTNQGSSQVKFNGVVASVSSWSDTSVTVTVPASAISGPVTLTEQGVVSNGVQFTVNSQFSITGISPASGAIGSSVTFTGIGFGATQSTSTASFYGAQATTITSWSDTQIVAVVPPGAATGLVSVKVAGVTTLGPTFTLTATAQLTDSLSHSSTYTAAMVGGVWYVSDAQGSGCSSCTSRGVIHHTFGVTGNILSATDELGHTTSYTYDSNGNVLTLSAPTVGGQTPTTTYTYNSCGQVLTVTDALGHVTTNTYDAKGNLTSVTTPAPDGSTPASVTQFAYDVKGQLTQITDPLGRITTIAYNPVGLISTITDAQNNVTSYAYDARGNRTAVTDALNKTTTFTYDAGDRLTQITAPSPDGVAPGPVTTFAYDYRGRRTSVTDANSKTTIYAYDDADRLTTVTDAATQATTYAYDTENNLVSITDANLHTTYFSYDAFGRITQTNFPSTLIETYAYDAVGNLTSKTDRKNQTINYVYDALDRLTHKGYPDSTGVDFVYDLVGKIQQVNDPTGTYAFAYDNMGRLIGTTTSYSFLPSRTFTTSYTYDKNSNRTGFTDPESGQTAYAYDTLNRLSTLTPPTAIASGPFTFSYDALSRRTQMTRPNNVATNYTYDNLSRLLSVLHQLSGTTIDGATYTVDNLGNRTAKTNHLPSAPTEGYTYDAIYQLTQVVQNGSTTSESYAYDPVGNRLSSLGVSPYSYNVSNQLTSIAGSPATTFTYDNNGNTTSKTNSTGATNYTWDFENRLTQVTLPGTGGVVSFTYDPMGRRIQKATPSATTVYIYDADSLIEETTASGVATSRYTQTQNIDEPLAMLRSSAASYYQADGLGSVTSLTNGTGTVAQTYNYDTFGSLAASTGSITNPFRYSGREDDSETGLYFFRARYYDSRSGRFISEDPVAFGGGANFFSYVNNDPIRMIDPFGLWGCNSDGTVDPQKVPSNPGEGAGAWAQYQYERGNKDFTYDSNKLADCGGSNIWKCNCFVKHAFTEGGQVPQSDLPKHYSGGKPTQNFATANELANKSLNKSILREGSGSLGDIVAWPQVGDSGHTGIIGCDSKIYSATRDSIQRWNRDLSLAQMIRYWFRREKVYRRCCGN